MTLAKDFFRSKTTWLGIAAILQAGISYFTGSLSAPDAIMAIYAALGALFMRDAIVKAGENRNGTR